MLLVVPLAGGSLPAAAETPSVACPAFTDITISQRAPGTGMLAVELKPPVPVAASSVPDSQALRLYYFVDRVVGIYPPNRGAMILIGGGEIPDGSAQIVRRITQPATETLDLEELGPGRHTVSAVLALGQTTCVETRLQGEPCEAICGPPKTLLLGSAEVVVNAQMVAAPRASEDVTGVAAAAPRWAGLLLILPLIVLLGSMGSKMASGRQ